MDTTTCSLTLSVYASAIEIAFAANLLIPAWAKLFDQFWTQQVDSEKSADDLSEDELIKRELSLRAWKKGTRFIRFVTVFLWRAGLSFCVLGAAALFLFVWWMSPDTLVCGRLWWWLLYSTSHLGPGLMILMVLIGGFGNWWLPRCEKRCRKIAAERNEQVTRLAEQMASEMIRRLETRGNPHAMNQNFGTHPPGPDEPLGC